ncbi:hypothetical protein D9619_000380 [Psilocybe cf. subviscida]|uniref:Sugar phosphate transporter domain-containing protein n=1 Tax=Psilocybe cf. subviscida TaxID=2480587 RepID=A0A8H5BGS1_9AGAR|nr:hypothetical protein D9619_000380 [Psilocybe cf. subviscida]
MSAAPRPPPSRLQIAGVIAFYMFSALVMVFVNKAVLNSTPDLPISFLFFQLAIAVVLVHFFASVSSTPLRRVLPGRMSVPCLEWSIARKLLSFVIVGVSGLLFNTLCLANVDASSFQIARGLSLPMTILVSAIFTRTPPRKLVVLSALVVTAGFFVGVTPSSRVSRIAGGGALGESTVAVAFGTLSSITLALHAVLMKSAYADVGSENATVKLMYYGNLMSAAVLLPFVVLGGEYQSLRALWAAGGEPLRVFVAGTSVTGVFGFMLGIASMLSIKVTSPVTHMFSSAARSVLQTILGMYFFHDILTVQRGSSILVITLGALLYTWVQSLQKPAPKSCPSEKGYHPASEKHVRV